VYYAQRDELTRLAYFLTAGWSVAEDLVQEAFVRTWRAWPPLRDPGAATARSGRS
jgi:DNA-directed RNA polymerase specialized sigma24 family protein